jgi:hypothetical protein
LSALAGGLGRRDFLLQLLWACVEVGQIPLVQQIEEACFREAKDLTCLAR